MNRSFCFAFAAAAAIVTASVAANAQDIVTRHVDVVYSDLDLTTAQGRNELEKRIDAAAAMACGGNPKFSDTYRDAPQFHQRAFEDCRGKARNRALASLARHGVRVAAAH